MHCTGQFDTRSAIGLCKAIEPADPLWIEDPLTVNYSEAWLELKRSTRVPLLAGEKVELVRGFRPYLDNQVLDMIHPDVAYSGGITGCKKIADYAALTRTPVGLHSGPCSLIRFYASVHLSGAIQNFFKIENALGEFRGFKEKMASGKQPVVRKSVMQYPDDPGLGLEINEDWLRQRGELPRTQRLQRTQTKTAPDSSVASVPFVASSTRQRLSYMERREFEALPARIEALEAEQSALGSRIADSEFYKEPAAAIADALARAQQIDRELAELYARWDALDSRAT